MRPPLLVDVLICHLTRMRPPLVCTAGINLGTLKHVRPLPQSGHLDEKHLHTSGGVLRLGRIVRFLTSHPAPMRPESEDTRATFRTAQVVGEMSARECWDRMIRVAHRGEGSLRSIFGEDLKRIGLTHAVDVGHGCASLGLACCDASSVTCTIRDPSKYNSHKQVRLSIDPGAIDHSAAGRGDLPVTDIRFYPGDHTIADEQAAADANVLLRNSKTAIVALGLTRPFAKDGDEPRHWLQVNGVFPDAHPLWHA